MSGCSGTEFLWNTDTYLKFDYPWKGQKKSLEVLLRHSHAFKSTLSTTYAVS